jgi:arabinogalactan endo-1,4-beta-galactosidase
MILGIDISTYYEEQEAGARYFRAGKPVDILNEFKKNGISCVRIRLWVDPYSEKGEPYLAGTCDLANFLKLAKLVNSYEMSVMLDFHYSDFRCDPSKQSLPKAWENLSYEDLLTEVYTYTRSVLLKAKEEKIDISYIQIGNEITNGMLWPSARLAENADNSSEERSGYDKLIPLIKEGVKAAREVLPKAKLILHLERSFDQKIYDEFFGRMKGANVDFDIIGMSYYPYWHKGFTELFANVENVKKYGKDIMIVETGYAFTL